MAATQGDREGAEDNRQRMVEVALGWRLVQNGASGYQAVSLETNRRAVVEGEPPKPVVRPATALEWRMWQLLLAGEAGWLVCGSDEWGLGGGA